MNINPTIKQIALLAGAALATGASAAASITFSSGYFGTTVHTHQGTGVIVGFDRAADGHLYYTTDADWSFGGFHRWNGANQTTLVNANSDFTGSSVVAIGNHVYYNTSDFTDQKIFRFGPVSNGSPTTTLISTTPNSGLHTHDGALFITGSIGFGTNHIYHSTLDAQGGLNSDPATDLGVTFGSSGPLAFDGAGNLFYAPGFGDHSIYRWSAEQVAAAIADPVGSPLPTTGVLWANYSELYGDVAGATAMAFDYQGELALTLTSFDAASYLVRFGMDGTGHWSGGHQELLSTTDRLGELRNFDGQLYLAVGDTILQVIPEPRTWALLFGLFAAGAVFVTRSRQRTTA